MNDDELLTSVEAARLLRVHPKHLYRLLRQGLPGHRIGRGNWRFKRSEVLAWLEARGRGGTVREGGLDLHRPPATERERRWFVGRVGGRWVGYPAASDHPHASDAFAQDDAASPLETIRVSASRTIADLSANLLVAGCAPLLGVVLDRLEGERERGRAHWLSVNSTVALRLLADGLVHTAGVHLCEEANDGDHASIVRHAMPGRSFHLVHLVRWRQGFAMPRRNPKGITSAQDLARPDVRVALREKGSGARRVLDRALRSAGVRRAKSRAGVTLGDHRSVARAVALGAFDVGITVESAAIEAGLRFVPLVEEAFDLVAPIDVVEEGGLGRVLDALDSAMLRREVASLGPYDASRMGHVRTVSAR